MNAQSDILYKQAIAIIPGGVNSPVRSFSAVECSPIYFKRAHGAYLTDVDDKSYVDYVNSFGANIIGHSDPGVVSAIVQATNTALSYGAPHKSEIDIAHIIRELMPNLEMIRFVNSGTEACMTAIRLARGATKRNKIIKFRGGYHGHVDALLAEAGSGMTTLGIPSSPGIPSTVTQDTLIAEYNDSASVSALFQQHANEIAAIIVEPIAGNMSLIKPKLGFLQHLRNLCTQNNSLLIFDEVMTGFRVDLGGAQNIYQIKPDLTTLGKVIGGGLPVGAVGGNKDLMLQLAPTGPIYQAGTLSGNPITLAAGIQTLKSIMSAGFHQQLSNYTSELTLELMSTAKEIGIPFCAQSIGGMFGLYFHKYIPDNFKDMQACNQKHFITFFQQLLKHGIYLPPSAYEACFISAAHKEKELIKTITSAKLALQAIPQKTTA